MSKKQKIDGNVFVVGGKEGNYIKIPANMKNFSGKKVVVKFRLLKNGNKKVWITKSTGYGIIRNES